MDSGVFMKFLVDADTIFDFFKGKTELFELFDHCQDIYVSTVTLGELNARARLEEGQKAVEIAEDFVHLLHMVNVDERIALEYGKLKAEYGQITDNKLWLCATAIACDLVLVSADLEFLEVRQVVVKRVC